jgi:hypothetical protein
VGSEEALNEDEADAGKEKTIVEAGTLLKENYPEGGERLRVN